MLDYRIKNRIDKYLIKERSNLYFSFTHLWDIFANEIISMMGICNEFFLHLIKYTNESISLEFYDSNMKEIKKVLYEDIEFNEQSIFHFDFSKYSLFDINKFYLFYINISFNFKKDSNHFMDIDSSNTHSKINHNMEKIRIDLNINTNSNIQNLLAIKEELFLNLIYEFQYVTNKYINKIKNKDLLILDSLFEEINFIRKYKDFSLEESKQYILNYHKHMLRNYTYEKTQNLLLSIDYLDDNLF